MILSRPSSLFHVPSLVRLERTSTARYAVVHLCLVPALLTVLALVCEYGPTDIDVARLFFDPAAAAFPWRQSAFLEIVGHQAARSLPIFVGVVAFIAAIGGYVSRRLQPWSMVLLAVAIAVGLGPLLVSRLKDATVQHCPVAMKEFGGTVDYLQERDKSIWATSPQSAGRCLPSGHAAGGYALLSLYFVGWLTGRRRLRWAGLAVGAGAGLLFSLVRIMQGAHFASATIWSADVDWIVCSLIFLPFICDRPARAG